MPYHGGVSQGIVAAAIGRRFVAQGARLPGRHRHVMPGIVKGLVATETARMLGDDIAVLADDDPLGIGMDLDRPPDGAGGDAVAVAVEAHEAGLRHRDRRRVEAVERSAVGDQARPFPLERLPDRPVLELGMSFGIG